MMMVLSTKWTVNISIAHDQHQQSIIECDTGPLLLCSPMITDQSQSECHTDHISLTGPACSNTRLENQERIFLVSWTILRKQRAIRIFQNIQKLKNFPGRKRKRKVFSFNLQLSFFYL